MYHFIDLYPRMPNQRPLFMAYARSNSRLQTLSDLCSRTSENTADVNRPMDCGAVDCDALPSLSELNLTNVSTSKIVALCNDDGPGAACAAVTEIDPTQPFLKLTESCRNQQQPMGPCSQPRDYLESLSEPLTFQASNNVAQTATPKDACDNPPSISELDLTDPCAGNPCAECTEMCCDQPSAKEAVSANQDCPCGNTADEGCFVAKVQANCKPEVKEEKKECKPRQLKVKKTKYACFRDSCGEVPEPSGRKHQWYTCGGGVVCCHLKNERPESAPWYLDCKLSRPNGCQCYCRMRQKEIPPHKKRRERSSNC